MNTSNKRIAQWMGIAIWGDTWDDATATPGQELRIADRAERLYKRKVKPESIFDAIYSRLAWWVVDGGESLVPLSSVISIDFAKEAIAAYNRLEKMRLKPKPLKLRLKKKRK